MKQIITQNVIIKKLLIVIVISVMLFTYILPIKLYAINEGSAQVLYEAMQRVAYDYSISVSDDINDYNNFISNLEKIDKNNYIKKNSDGSVTIYVENFNQKKDEIKNLFKDIVDEDIAELCIENIYNVILNVKEQEKQNINKNADDDSSNLNTEKTNSLAQDLKSVIEEISKDNGFTVPMNIETYEKVIEYIKQADKDNNEITSEHNGRNIVITMNVTSLTAVTDGFNKYFAEGWGGNIAANLYSSYGLLVSIKGNANYSNEAESEGLNEKDAKVYNYLRKNYKISKNNALIMINEKDKDGNYLYMKVTWKDDGKEVESIDIDTTHYDMNFFETEEAFNNIQKVKAKENDTADIGGILLSPVFSLVNFVADAIVSGLGSIMMGEGSGFLGLGVLSGERPSTGTYTNTVSRSVNTKSFTYQYPHINYTPEEIFAGQVPLLSIDFISGKVYDKSTNKNANQNTDSENNENDELKENSNKGWMSIRKVISQWYQVLRMIAIVGFLSVLIYTGIKIIISSNARDKAKYKEWIMNWLIGVAILFFMHYIMAFIISINGEFGNLISTSFTGIHVIPSDNNENAFDTNLMGLVRFMIQSKNFYIKVGYEIMYIALIVYTIKFTFIYLKRVLNMAFLTLIAPIVALTYPIDKMNDGKAQGFDMWLKEYIFNALLQPMHCILYYVLVGTAIDVAVSNPIYAVVVLAFMTEAEKIFKKIFGFDKANPGTVGGMSSAFAAGTIASGIVKDVAKFSKGNKGKGGNAGGNTQNNPLDNVKPLESGSIEDNFKDNLLDGGDSPSGNTTGGTQGGGNSSNGNTTGGTPTRGSSTSRNNSTNKDSSTDSKEPATGKGPSVKNGLKNVGKKLIRPIYDFDRSKEYNGRRLVRRLGSTAKSVGKLAIGTAAAAVQAGISITDGKYSLKEGIASFAAGYAGGEKILNGIGKPISSVVGAYREGYHEGDEKYLRERQKQQFMDNDEIYKMYKNKYGSKAETMQKLAADNMVPYGYTDVKEQFKIQKMANEIIKKNDQYKNYNDTQKQEYMEKALKQARNTKSFIDSPGVSGIVHSPGKQEDYIKAEIKSRGITDEKSQEAQAIKTGLQNAFNSAALWQQVNK